MTDTHRHGILLAEDDADTRDAMLALLEHEGYEATAVCNGREALDILHEGFRPCVILLDLAMPEMDGFEFRRHQVADPDLATIPVFVVSAGAYTKEYEARRMGLETFFRKPMDMATFMAAVPRHCQRTD
jgi:CheY-like chemotaxis protein